MTNTCHVQWMLKTKLNYQQKESGCMESVTHDHALQLTDIYNKTAV